MVGAYKSNHQRSARDRFNALRDASRDHWHALCRDTSHQRVAIIALATISALFYLVTALSFRSDSTATTTQHDSRYEIPEGFRAVAMQSAGPLPQLNAGDYVDVIVDATVVLERALVIDVSVQSGRPATIVLAVPLSNAPTIANAASLGVAALVVVG